MPDLTGRVALVTGASRGVGRGIASVLGESGVTVYVSGRSVRGQPTTENLPGTIHDTADEVTSRGGQGIPVRCDHTEDHEVEALFQRIDREHNRLDLLVNNAWGGYEQYDAEKFSLPFWDQPRVYWHRMFTAGVRGQYVASCHGASLMIRQRKGLIVNVSAGDGPKFRGTVVYDMAKTAADRMMFGMAIELREHGVAAVSVCPGFTRTERVLAEYEGDLSATESPEYVGRAIAALAADPNVIERSGHTFTSGGLAQEYDFTDIDGRQVPPFEFPDP